MQIATDAIDRLHTTAESHNRVIVVEVMGRHAGWIAAYSGLAGGADAILVPERPFDIERGLRPPAPPPRDGPPVLDRRGQRGRAPDRPGRGDATRARSTPSATRGSAGIAVELESEIEERTGFETRMTILGHVQRGGTPNAYDRVLGTRFGVAAVDAVTRGRHRQDGRAARAPRC